MRLPCKSSILPLLAVSLAACQTAPVQQLPPAPRLLESATLELPADCAASGSFLVSFDVYENGRTGNIQPPAVESCVQTALVSWVASFRYEPRTAKTPMSVEWLMVSAKQGS